MQQEDLPMERNPTYQELQKSLSSWEQKTVEYKNTLKRLEMEKQQLQEALTKSGLRFREPADLLPTIVCELDTGMLVTYMNRIGLEVFCFPEDGLNGGINVVDLIHPDDRSRAVEQFELLMEGRKIQGAEYRLRKRDGTEMAGLLYASPLKKDGAVAGARMNITDITQRKRLEEQLQRAGKMETIVYSIIRKHNGHMHIDSKVGIGTTVEIYLPADASTISFRTLQDE